MQKLKFNVWGPFGIWLPEEALIGKQVNDQRCYETEREYIMLSGDQFTFEEYEPINELFDHEYYDFLLFTGLRDKQGREIYDGDIVRYCGVHSLAPIEFEVVWDRSELGWGAKFADTTEPLPKYNNPLMLEKIGNKYRNPELLGAA